MNRLLLCLGLLLGLSNPGMASETAAEPARDAQLVILCPGNAGGVNTIGVALVSQDRVETAIVLVSNSKATFDVPAGRHELVLFFVDPFFGLAVEHYVDADVAEGQVYFVAIQPNHERMLGEALAGLSYTAASAATRQPRFWLFPFKSSVNGTNGFSLSSPVLERWTVGCVNRPAEQPVRGDVLRSHITERLEKLRSRYGRGADPGHASFLDAGDGLAVGTSLSEAAIARALSSARSIVEEAPGTPLAEIPVPPGLDDAAVQKVIVCAARARQFSLVGIGPDRVAVQLVNRGTDATYTMIYDESKITIFERAFKVGSPKKPVSMRRWGENLRVDIIAYLGYASNNRTVPDEVMDMDPEHLTDGPTGAPDSTLTLPQGLRPGEVQQAIVDAGVARGYTVVARKKSQVALRINHRGKFVTIRFIYDHQVANVYADARRQSATGSPVDVEGWVATLVKVTQIMLERRTL